MLVPRRWWCSESGSSVYRAGCAEKDACGAAVTPRRRAASEAACVPSRANMRPRQRDSSRPLRRQSWRRQTATSKGSVIPTSPPSVFVSGSSQQHERCFKSVDTQCLTVVGAAGSSSHGNTFVHVPLSAPSPTLRPSTSHHHAPSSWLRRAWLATLVVMAVLGTPAAANTPPRFVLDGQSEIVIRLTEGEATPVGEYL